MRNQTVNKGRLVIVLTAAIMLLAATVISTATTDSAFARNEKYARDINQAASVSNSCLNPVFVSNTVDNVIGIGNCGSTVSQQGESGQASTPITHQAANPTIEVQPFIPQPPAPLEQALLLVFKEVVCPPGFEDVCPGAEEFTLVVDGVNPDPSGPFHPIPLFAFQVFLDPGPYQVFEILPVPDNPPGLELQPVDFSIGCIGVIQAGETRSCTFTNTYEVSTS